MVAVGVLRRGGSSLSPDFSGETTGASGGSDAAHGGRRGGSKVRGHAAFDELGEVAGESLTLAFELGQDALQDVVKHGLVSLGLADLVGEALDLGLEIFHLILSALTMLALGFAQLGASALFEAVSTL